MLTTTAHSCYYPIDDKYTLCENDNSERLALERIYKKFDTGGDGVHSFDEFETMIRDVDGSIPTRTALVYFNGIINARRRKLVHETQKAEMEARRAAEEASENRVIAVGGGKIEEPYDDDSEDEDEDEDVQENWEKTQSSKEVMLYHQLHGNESLSALKPSLIRRLVEGAEQKSYSPREFVFHEGDEGDGMYMLEEGELIVVKRDQEKSKDAEPVWLDIAHLREGALVGEQSLVQKQPRNAGLKSGPAGATCTFISKSLFDEIQYITGGALGEGLVESVQFIDFDDWANLIWDIGYHQPEIDGPWVKI